MTMTRVKKRIKFVSRSIDEHAIDHYERNFNYDRIYSCTRYTYVKQYDLAEFTVYFRCFIIYGRSFGRRQFITAAIRRRLY